MNQGRNPAPLVITRLIGGLGNQMFQYAAARALALRRGAALKLDLSGFSVPGVGTKRRYELGSLRIQANAATEAELAHFGPSRKLRPVRLARARRLLRINWRRRAWPVYQEPHFHFDPTITELSPPVYLDGFWQSEKYFSDIAETLRQEFTPAVAFDSENAAVAKHIDVVNAVSLHVRRGDYVTDTTTNRYHGICSPDFYRRAVDYVAIRLERPHLFIFSDDQQWTRANLRFALPMTFVDVNSPDRGYRDMQLMARCRHHIVANSSFSWWGAWLSPPRGKIVVAPRHWFSASSNDTRDLIPPNWVRL
jgi:hypothetical protein